MGGFLKRSINSLSVKLIARELLTVGLIGDSALEDLSTVIIAFAADLIGSKEASLLDPKIFFGVLEGASDLLRFVGLKSERRGLGISSNPSLLFCDRSLLGIESSCRGVTSEDLGLVLPAHYKNIKYIILIDAEIERRKKKVIITKLNISFLDRIFPVEGRGDTKLPNWIGCSAIP